MQEVSGSIPLGSTNFPAANTLTESAPPSLGGKLVEPSARSGVRRPKLIQNSAQ
jgi:hypothetical protein